MKKLLVFLFFSSAIFGHICHENEDHTCPFLTDEDQEIRCDWKDISYSSLQFPHDFLWGVATAAHQIEGGVYNNWTQWEEKQSLERSGKACNGWERDDIDLMQNLGINAYRFSVEWSRIEPIEGQFDESVLDHYKKRCDALLAAGITPMITLHHFTEPVWFSEKSGFEDEENIFYFVRFSKKVFQCLGDRVKYWCTINEPGTLLLQGYIRGIFPPGVFNPIRGGIFLKNILRAHVAVYQELKKMLHGSSAQIGIVHGILHFKPYHSGLVGFIESRLVTQRMQHIVTDAILHFFKTGDFAFSLIPFCSTHYYDSDAPHSFDFFGLNYYTEVLFNILKLNNDYRSGDIITDFPYAIYAEGLYNAIARVAQLNVPIIVTENGCSDGDVVDFRRIISLQRHLKILSHAIHDGFDVRGYFYWTLLDNFEWDHGYKQKFGLYHVDFASQYRTLRPGGYWFKSFLEQLKKND